jgi:serine/threonine-protein kinase
MKTRIALLLATLTLNGLTNARAADPDPDPALAAKGYNVLKTYCYRCHGLRFEVEGFNVLNRDILLTKTPDEDDQAKYVVAGKPDDSLMWQRAGMKKDMPPGKNPKPSAAELDVFKKWIEAGAPFPTTDRRKFVSEKDVYVIIRNDLRATPREDRRYRRYFSLANLHNNSFEQRVGKNCKNFDVADLRLARAGFAKLANSVSWKQEIVVPRIVDAGQAEIVLVVDLRDLGWDERNLWNEILKLYPYGLKQDVSTDDELRELSKEVYELTGTVVPFVRVDWFIDTASRPPLYHTLLNLPATAAELERQLKVNPDNDFLRDKLARAGFAESGVSTSNRLVDRHAALYGAYWKSYDFAKSEGTGNLFQFPLGPKFAQNPFPQQAFDHAGGELIFNLPNGLQGYLLVDTKGARIDKGPIEIVRDLKETSGSPEVVNGLSCMACHEHGMIRFKDTIRDGLAVFGDARLKVTRLFPKIDDMSRLLDKDEQRFMRSVDDAMGSFLKVGPDRARDVKSFPEPIGAIARHYQKDLELEDVAAELGIADPKELQTLIKLNPRLRELGLGPLMQGFAIKRTHWQSLERSLSPFQQTASELELGTPHRTL